MKIAEPKFWWNNQNSSLTKFFIWKWNLFLSFIIFLKNFFIRQYLPSIPVICIGNFVVGGQGKTPFVRFLRKKLELNDVKTCVISKGYGGSSRLTKVIDVEDSSGDFGDEAILHSTDGLTIVSKDRKRSFELLKQSTVDIAILDDGFQNPSIKKDINIILIDLSKGYGNGSLIPFGPLRESLSVSMKRTDLIIFIDSISEEHSSISTIKKLWNGPHLYAEYRTILDQNIKSNVVLYSGISNPKKFSYGVKKNNRNIIKSYVFHDHEKIDEQSAGKILDTAKKEGVDILTTEKDLARLLNSPKGSKREMLFLNSKVAKIDIIIDEEKLMNILVKNINIKLS